jgi:hypothetical protein
MEMQKWVLPVLPAALGCALLGLLSAPAAAAMNEAFDGTWMPDSYSDKLLTSDGNAPPLTKSAAKIYAQRIATQGDPDRQYDRTRWCAGPGIPRIMFMPYAFEIRSDGDYLGFIYNWYRWHRVVDMSGQKGDPVLPVTMGYPVGQWDGDTLLIDTIGIEDETVLDAMGLPHSEDMKLNERLRLLPNGHLEDRFTIDDAANYTHPWEAVMTYHRAPDVVVGDDVCPDRIAKGGPATRSSLP